ncbi:unnamed protein product, partial [Didymodactylos carnosus]
VNSVNNDSMVLLTNTSIHIKTTAFYSLRIKTDKSFRINLTVKRQSSHGYLLPTQYPLLLVYRFNSFLFLFLLIFWTLSCYINRHSLSLIHLWILIILITNLIGQSVELFNYEYQNHYGLSIIEQSLFLWHLFLICDSTLCLILIIFLAHGYGFIAQYPSIKNKFISIFIGLFYFTSMLFNLFAGYNFINIKEDWILICVLSSCLIMFGWLITGIHRITKLNNQKYNLYFRNVFLFTLVTFLLFLVWLFIDNMLYGNYLTNPKQYW